MSAGSNQKSLKQNENTSDDSKIHKKAFNAEEDKSLTFKDWKTINDSETKSKTVNKQTKSKSANKTCDRDLANFIVHRQGNAGFLPHYRSMPKTFNGMNNFDICGTRFATFNNNYNAFQYFGYNNFNSFDRQNNFIKNNYNMPNILKGQHAYHFTNNRNLPGCFFASDGIYRQKDLMQKPLPNPFKNEVKAKQLLQELGTAQHNNAIKNPGNAQNNMEKVPPSSDNKTLTTKPLNEEAKIYVSNPNASTDGKAFIPKPKLPEENLQISKEEKKRQWKEYREAMKPFKNREFYNAKRVVQRLGKKDIKELDEKELFRLTNAREVMSAHKARLTAKYSDYVKAEGKSNELGEVYVLKKPHLKDWETGKTKQKNNLNYNFPENRSIIIEHGRKILGGYSSLKGFVPGGMLNVSTQRTGQISAL